MSFDYQFFLREQRDELAILTLNNEGANPFVPEMHEELSQILDDLNKDDAVLGLVFVGRDRFFSAGANIAKMVDFSEAEAHAFGAAGQRSFRKIEHSRFVTVAAINGVAAGGGCELSLACDFRIASPRALLGQPEVNIGAIPGWGGSRRLARVIGYPRALELILTGDLIKAARALEIGLVNKVVDSDEDVLSAAIDFARRITNKAPRVIEAAKLACRAGFEETQSQAEAVELEGFAKSFASPDRLEGMSAFLSKRAANFSRRF